MNIGKFVLAIMIASFMVAVAAMLTPQVAQAQCVPGQVCPPAPGGDKEKKRKPTETPVPTPVAAATSVSNANLAPLPIPPASGSGGGGSPNGGGGGGSTVSKPPVEMFPPAESLLNSPWGLVGLLGLIIVVCFGGGFLLLRNRGGLGSIGGSGRVGQLGHDNFTLSVRDSSAKFEKILPAVQNLGGGPETGTVTRPDLMGDLQNATVTRPDLMGDLQNATVTRPDLGGQNLG